MVLLCFAIPLVLYSYALSRSGFRALLVGMVGMIFGYAACNEIGKFSLPKNDMRETPLTEHVEGCIDEITSGSTHRFAKDIGHFMVFQGSKLMIQGWIGSIWDPNAPVKISFVTKAGEETGLEFMVIPTQRYDVADAKQNFDLMNAGFVGTVALPEGFPPGRYLLRVEKGTGSKRQYFISETEIRVAAGHFSDKP